jgi:hypothetical protein
LCGFHPRALPDSVRHFRYTSTLYGVARYVKSHEVLGSLLVVFRGCAKEHYESCSVREGTGGSVSEDISGQWRVHLTQWSYAAEFASAKTMCQTNAANVRAWSVVRVMQTALM